MENLAISNPNRKKGLGNILFVDDEIHLVEVWRKILTGMGYTVTGCTDSMEALATFKQTPDAFDAIVTDQVMPKLLGTLLGQEALAIRPDIPVFLCTGFSETITEERAIRSGFRRIFLKPIACSELSSAIQEAIGHPNDKPQASHPPTLHTQPGDRADTARRPDRAGCDTPDQTRLSAVAEPPVLATMSHEIRTPLHAIIGMTELALQHEMSPKLMHYLTKISQASHSLMRMLNNILDYSKIDSERLVLTHNPFTLWPLFDRLSDLFGGEAEKKGVQLLFRYTPECMDRLVGDELRLEQILINLIGNAIKFTHRGEIEVAVHPVGVATEKESVLMQFSVRDTGIGLAEEGMASLFEPFVQADGTITHQYGGSGLGLAICKRLAEKMGGRIWVESKPGEGSLFQFTACFTRPEDEVDISQISERVKGACVLLAEDNPLNQQFIKAVLEEVGLSVDLASTGLEATQLSAIIQYDLILMDLHMPDMDGYTATRRIHDNFNLRDLPIIALTTDVMGDVAERCLAAGMRGCLTKPIDRKKLFSVLEEWIHSKNTQRRSTRRARTMPLEEMA